MRKELWDRRGANIASRQKEMYGKQPFPRPKKGILEREQHFFRRIFIENVFRECWDAENVSFSENNREICDKIYR